MNRSPSSPLSRRAWLRLASAAPAAALVGGVIGAASSSLSCAGATPPASSLPSPWPPAPAGARAPIRAVAFDLFTLFDPRSVLTVAEELVPGGGPAFVEAWRSRQFQYSWLRATAGQYRDFRSITEDAVAYAARARGVQLDAAARRRLVDANEQLEPWSDTAETLRELRRRGLRLVTLANFTLEMQRVLIGRVGLLEHFEHLISSDELRAYKPEPRAYQLGCERLSLPRQQIAFSAFGAWDAAGASWFGFPTFWVNRLGVPEEELDGRAEATGASLVALRDWISQRDALRL